MDLINELSAQIMSNLQFVLLGLTLLILFALIIFININIKLGKMNRRYKKMMQGMEGVNLERILMAHIEEVRQVVKQVEDVSQVCQRLERTIKNCVQKVGIVRFNAFEDMGSDLSFAVALLDEKNNGVVITGIYGRNETRTYAKPIENGASTYFLTEEEKEALVKALENN
jgi:hypothetical protein